MKSTYLLLISIFTLFSTVANAEFHAFQSTMEIAERGTVDSIIVDTDEQRYSFMLPPGCQASIDETERAIVFGNKKSSLKIQWGNCYLNGLPDENTLRTVVLNRYPEAAVLQSRGCAIGAGSGWFFDLKRAYAVDYSVTIRHAILPCRGGAFEFVLTASSRDFPSQQGVFSAVTSSFHVIPKDVLNVIQ